MNKVPKGKPNTVNSENQALQLCELLYYIGNSYVLEFIGIE